MTVDLDGLLIPKATKRQRESRILVIDIERLPGLARLWEPRTDYVPPSNWVRWPSLLCFAAKWLHGPMEFRSVWADGMDGMVRRAWEMCDEADVIVGYNSVRFDMKHLRSEWVQAGMPMPRPWKDVDLFAEVRRSLGFESKSLDQVCKRLGVPGKSGHYSMDDAEAAKDGDGPAQRRMERYNRADVRITEAAYLRLLGWLPGHPHVGRIGADDETLTCSQCGSDDLQRVGTYRAVVNDYPEYRCRNCNGLVRSGHSSRVAMTRGVR